MACWRVAIVINGSFVSDAYEPNDVDCALLIGPDYPIDANADGELQQGLPFIQAEFLTKRHLITMSAFSTARTAAVLPKVWLRYCHEPAKQTGT